jgi:non-canonical (house-cleaning) NTP pyrophosphatase
VPTSLLSRAWVGQPADQYAASTLRRPLAAAAALPSGVRAESKVRDQPLGFEETLRGARNRLETIMECPEAEEADLAIAIENGIVCVRDGTDAQDENWVDLAIIIVRDLKSGKESLSSSVGLQLPSSTVADWAEAGAEGTLGSWLATERTGCDSQDPHAHLTGGAYPRAALLEQAIGAAYATLRHA